MTATQANILIVEDEYIIASSIQRTAEGIDGVHAVIVSNGQAALDHIASTKTDLILMDIGLPGKLNGLQTAALIREQSDIPIIFMSGYSDDETRRQIDAMSKSVFITKPITQYDLRIQLEAILNKSVD